MSERMKTVSFVTPEGVCLFSLREDGKVLVHLGYRYPNSRELDGHELDRIAEFLDTVRSHKADPRDAQIKALRAQVDALLSVWEKREEDPRDARIKALEYEVASLRIVLRSVRDAALEALSDE